MMNRDELAKRLNRVSVEDIAKEAGVSTKTIYRLRHKKTEPGIDLVLRLTAALTRVEKRAAKAAA